MNNKWRFALGIAALAGTLALSACTKDNTEPLPGNDDREEATASPSSTEQATPVPTQPPDEEEAGPTDEPYAVAATGLRIPWSIAFHEDIIYMSEREGNIVKLEEGETTRQTVRLAKPVHHEGEGGFLGFVLAPEFAETETAYAYHTYRDGGSTYNRVVLLKLDGSEWAEQRALLECIPGDLYHNGGRMAIGPDQHLYVTTGDALETALSQDPENLAGKILRMTLDGEIPLHNPIGGTYVYSYGHRNPQGVAWTSDGAMYSTEHGPSGRPGGHDEINLIEPGGNYGWPEVLGDGQKEGMIPPLYHTGEEAIAPSGTIIDEEGRLLIAGLRGESIYRYTPSTGEIETIHEGDGRIRDLALRDGKLYFITNNQDGRGRPTAEDDRLIAIDYNE